MLRYFTRKVISGVLSTWLKNSTEGHGLDNDLEAIGVSVTMRKSVFTIEEDDQRCTE